MKRPPSTLRQWLGLRLLSEGGGEATFEFEPREEVLNSNGAVHGGILSTLADIAMSVALRTILPPDRHFVTVELKINFMVPARGLLTVRGRVLHQGGRLAVVQGELKSASGLVAVSQGTFYSAPASGG